MTLLPPLGEDWTVTLWRTGGRATRDRDLRENMGTNAELGFQCSEISKYTAQPPFGPLFIFPLQFKKNILRCILSL